MPESGVTKHNYFLCQFLNPARGHEGEHCDCYDTPSQKRTTLAKQRLARLRAQRDINRASTSGTTESAVASDPAVTYGLQDSRMVPRLRCSCTNLLISACSVWVRGRSRPGRVAGAFGRSSMAWSQTEWRGSLCDFSSSNTCLCRLYSSGTSRRTSCLSSSGTSIRSVDCMVWGWMVTLPM